MHISEWISLNHLDRMTDSTGLVQHAIYSLPRRESGYTTDDNARALRLCTRLWSRQGDQRMLQRISTYLSFLEFAHCPGRGFHNFMSYQRYWLDAEGCGDCQGQAVRALAEVLGSTLPDDFRQLSRELIKSVLPFLADLRSIRAQAYIVLAWGHLWATGTEDIEQLESAARGQSSTAREHGACIPAAGIERTRRAAVGAGGRHPPRRTSARQTTGGRRARQSGAGLDRRGTPGFR